MRVLLDENLPHDLRHFLPGHEVATVTYRGWTGLLNGELLAKAAEDGFDVMVTLDSGIEYQQNLVSLPVSVVIIAASSSKLEVLRPIIPNILEALDSLEPRSLVRVPS